MGITAAYGVFVYTGIPKRARRSAVPTSEVCFSLPGLSTKLHFHSACLLIVFTFDFLQSLNLARELTCGFFVSIHLTIFALYMNRCGRCSWLFVTACRQRSETGKLQKIINMVENWYLQDPSVVCTWLFCIVEGLHTFSNPT